MKKNKKKEIWISFISFIFLVVILFYIFVEGFFGLGSESASGFVEQSNLRKSLGNWYQLVFYTYQVNLIFLFLGTFYFLFSNNIIYKNFLFCYASYLIYCLFAMFVFKFDSFSYNFYEAFKTIIAHLIIPSFSLLTIFLIRKEIILKWKILWINSFYVPLWIMLSVIIYYNFQFVFNGKPLWIYAFLDYDNQIFWIPLPGVFLTVLGLFIILTFSPATSVLTFLVPKYIFNVKTEKTTKEWINKLLWK